MVLLFHIMGVMRNLQLLSRPRAVLQGWGLFLLWRWRPRFCAVRGGPIGQHYNNSYQCAYRPGEHRAIRFFFVAASERSGFRVGRPGSATNARSRRASLAAASFLSRRSVLAFLEAAPARPAAAFFSSFSLDVRLGADVVSAVTLKTGCVGCAG